MGLYDNVTRPFETICECGNIVNGFQTKDKDDAYLKNVNFTEVNKFYSECDSCKRSYEYTLDSKSDNIPIYRRSLDDYFLQVTRPPDEKAYELEKDMVYAFKRKIRDCDCNHCKTILAELDEREKAYQEAVEKLKR